MKKQLELVNLTYGEKTLPLTSQNLNMILADANISIDKIRSPDYETDEVPDYNTT